MNSYYYYDYEVEATYMPTDKDYQDWTEHLRMVEVEEHRTDEPKGRCSYSPTGRHSLIETPLSGCYCEYCGHQTKPGKYDHLDKHFDF